MSKTYTIPFEMLTEEQIAAYIGSKINDDTIVIDEVDINLDDLTDEQAEYLLENGYVRCEDCGDIILEGDSYTVYDEYGDIVKAVCEDCIDYYSYCEETEAYYVEDAMAVINPYTRHEEYISRASNRYLDAYICDHCGEAFDADYTYTSHNAVVCDSCYTNYYCTCEDCGDIILTEDAIEIDGCCYCEDCAEDHRGIIEDYHHDNRQDRLVFHKMPDEETELYLGVELEVEAKSYSVNLDRAAEDVKDICEELIVKEDGSLDTGFEMVSQPCTLNYHLSRMPWEKITKSCLDNGMLSDKASNCGLHVHVSRQGLGSTSEQQDLTIAKLLVLFDRFEAQIEQFARRKSDRWAAFYKTEGKDIETDMYYTLRNKAGGYDMARYHAINLVNIHTIEFRVFKGSLNIETVKATIQFVHTIVNFAIKADLLTVQNCEWSDMFKDVEYDELKAYLNRRHLD